MPAAATRFRQRLQSWSVQVAGAWGPILADDLRPEAPIGTPTPTSTRPPGELRRSIRSTVAIPTTTGARFQIQAPVIQAATTDRGARPHIIRARRATVLRFWWESGPHGPGVHYFPRVSHPGNAPGRWWEPALQKVGSSSLRKAARRVRF